jgi:inner membrane protein
MDNLTHSLVGALLGQMGLKRKTGLAMPTLIIAANIPDIDAVAVLLGGHQHLALRRGLTHGPIAIVLLPLVLWAAMLWFDRWQERRGKRPEKRLPVDKRWLLALAYIGCLSHPLFDWFNSYGIRLLEPFSSQWFYGDSLFIIDVWIWAALIAGVWLSMRRERRGQGSWTRPAFVSVAAICTYVLVNGLITGDAETRASVLVKRANGFLPSMVVANPVPVKFWEREILWRYQPTNEAGFAYGSGDFSILSGARLVHFRNTIGGGRTNIFAESDQKNTENLYYFDVVQKSSAEAAFQKAKRNADLSAFLFWSRMPVFRVYSKEDDAYVVETSDQRFQNGLVRERFMISIPCNDRCE